MWVKGWGYKCYTVVMGKVVEKTKKNVKETQVAVFSQTATLLNGALALIAALAWNEAVKAFIERFFPAGSTVISKFLYAITITVFVVIITRYIKKVEDKFSDLEQK